MVGARGGFVVACLMAVFSTGANAQSVPVPVNNISVTASSHDGNRPANTLDGRFDTRWSANGIGEWIEYDLGQVYDLRGVDMAFYQGGGRVAYFTVSTSRDGNDWRQVYPKVEPIDPIDPNPPCFQPPCLDPLYQPVLLSQLETDDRTSSNSVGSSSGNTVSLQRFEFSRADARYVKITGYGNSSNNSNRWHSLTRFVPVVAGQNDRQPVWSEDFGTLPSGSPWNRQALGVQEDCGVGSGPCVRATYVPTDSGSNRIIFRKSLPPATAYTLSYDVRFGSDHISGYGFDFVKGGKLHGLGPENPIAGCNPSRDPSRWSARVMWRSSGNPFIYHYEPGRARNCGDGTGPGDFNFSIGQYHAVSLYVRVNDPFWSRRGEIELYVDGERVASRSNVQLRKVSGSSTLINNFMFNTFFGGGNDEWSPPRPLHAYFDNFSVYSGRYVRQAPGLK